MFQINFDDIMTNRVGLGRAQLESFAILSIIDFIDGFQEILNSVLIKILTIQFNLKEWQESLMASIYFIGIVMGNAICALVSDRVGRRILLLWGSFITFIAFLLSSFVENFAELIILRLILGLVLGLTFPISIIIVAEIFPYQVRGRFVVLLQLMFIVGMLYMIASFNIFLDDYEHGNWRSLIIYNSIPPALCFIGSYFILKESPRYYFNKARFEDAFNGINQMIQKNKKNHKPLDQEEQLGLKNWYASINIKKKPASISELFVNFRVLLSIWAIYACYNIQSVGTFVLIPFIFSTATNQFWPLFAAYSVELIAIFLVTFVIDSKKLGGRKRIAISGLLFLCVIEFILFFVGKPFIIAAVIMIRFAIRVTWSSFIVICSESFPTRTRSLGVGCTSGIGKIFGSISPFFMIPLFYVSPYLPFLLAAIICLFTAILVYNHPLDLTNEPLDSLEQQLPNSINTTVEMPEVSLTQE